MPTQIHSIATSHTFSQEVLRALALGSFPQSPAEKSKSTSVVRSALRCRRRRGLSREQREMVGNVFCATGEGGGVDPSCSPVFHGGPKIVKTLKPNKIGVVFFTPSQSSAEFHATKTAGRGAVFSASLDINNPLIVVDVFEDDEEEDVKKMVDKAKEKYHGRTVITGSYDGLTADKDFIKKTKERGHDAIISGNGSTIAVFSSVAAKFQKYLQQTTNSSPIVVSKLAPYLHDLLGDVTKKQSRVIAQTVKRGIERKWADSTVARTLAGYADLDPERAKVVARTEMARARSDASLGKRPDAAKVVFVLGDEDACPICKALEGTVRTVRKAQGVIPVHPNCSCRWDAAPKGAKVTANQFCATGAGGGIDPHCSPDDGDGGVTDHRIAHINLPESREEATAIAWAMRDNVIGDGEDDCAVDGDCLIAAAEGFMLHPDAEIWGGRYIDSEKGPWEHQIVKMGDWFIDVTEDQFSNVKSQATVFNTDDLLRGKNGAAPYQYAGFERLHATEEMTLKRRKPGYRPGTVEELANYEGTDRLLAVPKPTANFRDSLLRFSALNQFCATGEGGGVDPSCSSGGKDGSGHTFTVKPPKKLYRGIIGDGQKGAGTFSLGKGLYSTSSKSFLKGFKYDKIIELTPEEAFPRNPLILRTADMFSDWLLKESGERRMSDFNKKYPDPGTFVASKGYDGVMAGDEIVKYSKPS